MLSGFVILQVQVCKADSKRQKDENKIQEELGYIYNHPYEKLEVVDQL